MAIPSFISDLNLRNLGWSAVFDAHLEDNDQGMVPARVSKVHRTRMTAQTSNGPLKINLAQHETTNAYAVGDWILVDPTARTIHRSLQRQTLLQRRTEGGRQPQLIVANVDTLFIVTSCNDDFNAARLERYLALANEAGTKAVIVLTKSDQTDDVTSFETQAHQLQRDLPVVAVNAKDNQTVVTLSPWCGIGQTVALIGSSGVGKSTLLNTLTAATGDAAQLTGNIREDDAKGRHTTTARSLHQIEKGGLLIDTPGMRTLQLSDVSTGIDQLFAEITEHAPSCRFRDCTHAHEPGCAVQAAVSDGKIDPDRLDRWRKLAQENEQNTPVEVGARGNKHIKGRGKRR